MLEYVKLFFVSMLPLIELRGGIPLGLLWGIPFWTTFAICLAGNLLPVPFLIPFARKILFWLAGFEKIGWPFRKIIDIGNRKVAKVNQKAIWMGLFLFVAFPLPGTGAWTGCLVATLLQMKLRDAFWPIALGVLCCGIIMGIGTYGVAGLWGLLAR